MITIFIFSGQQGESSSGVSDTVGEVILDALDIDIPQGQTASEVNIFAGLKIRNFAHIFLYLCLGFSSYLLSASLWGLKMELRPLRVLFAALCAFAFCFLYGCSDEFHQSFIDGRTATMRDVFIDCIGITFAVVICAAIQIISWSTAVCKRKNS